MSFTYTQNAMKICIILYIVYCTYSTLHFCNQKSTNGKLIKLKICLEAGAVEGGGGVKRQLKFLAIKFTCT